jgi:hypothetical protein
MRAKAQQFVASHLDAATNVDGVERGASRAPARSRAWLDWRIALGCMVKRMQRCVRELGLSSENFPTAGFAKIVAVLGDANRLTARRSTAARSAFNLHTLRRQRLATWAGGGRCGAAGVRGAWLGQSASHAMASLLRRLTIELTCVRRLA